MAVSPETKRRDTADKDDTESVEKAKSLESKPAARRGRYARSSEGSPLTLTPQKQALLRFLGECRLFSLPQLARLCCPSEQSARRHLRELFDAGLVDIVAVSRSALSPAGTTNDASLLHGSAPNLYVPTKAGLESLVHAGLLSRDALRRPVTALGPKNSLFLAHELAVRDARVWLETNAAGHPPRGVLRWCDGTDAHLPLQPGVIKSDSARPDAWFVYQIGWHQNASGENFSEQTDSHERSEPLPLVLVGLVEVDRGTERGSTRWAEKMTDYRTLFGNKEVLRATTGYRNARVLIFVPDARRRDSLSELIAAQIRERGFPAQLLERFWIAEHSLLLGGGFGEAAWRRPGVPNLSPLLAAEMLGTPTITSSVVTSLAVGTPINSISITPGSSPEDLAP